MQIKTFASTFTLALAVIAQTASAFPTWMGVYGGYAHHTDGSNPGTFTVLMNQDYFGLHANVGIRVNSQTWTEFSMTYAGSDVNAGITNSIWAYTPPAAYATGAVVEYYFHGYDDYSSSNIYDSNNSANYLFKIFAASDPEITSWFTGESTKYARVQTSTAASSTGTVTWTGQTSPVYAGIQEVASDANYVYARSYGLAGYVMGPWYNDVAKTQPFPNWPAARSNVWRFARTPAVAATKSLTSLGAIGLYVNGVSLFDNRDGFVWTGSGESGMGTGYWYRDAWVIEGVTFDSGYAHQPPDGNYHYHAYPPALRYQLGDNITLSNGVYVESSGPLKHSPILAWVADGFPLYGPYGYANPTNPASGVRRMVSGYVLRNGQFGTDNLAVTGRLTIPAWAQRAYNTGASHTCTNVTTGYELGRYLEDNDYLGDHGFTQGVDFDLNEYNARWCVTPEFPDGTWAYFCTLTSSNMPAFPYAIGRQFLGTPYTTTFTSIPAGTTNYFKGGPNTVESMSSITTSNADVTLVWNSVEGGTYTIQASPDITNSNNWTSLTTNFTANAGTTTAAQEVGGASNSQRFYRIGRNGLAPYWPAVASGGSTSVAPGGSANRGSTVTVTITLPTNPPQPPSNLMPSSVTLAGTITGTNISRPASGTVIATFTIPGSAPTGPQNIAVVFNPAPTYNVSFTIN
jgi:hypothetical protein